MLSGIPEALSLKEILNKNNYCSMISTDIGGAFDQLNWFVIVQVIALLPTFDYLK